MQFVQYTLQYLTSTPPFPHSKSQSISSRLLKFEGKDYAKVDTFFHNPAIFLEKRRDEVRKA